MNGTAAGSSFRANRSAVDAGRGRGGLAEQNGARRSICFAHAGAQLVEVFVAVDDVRLVRLSRAWFVEDVVESNPASAVFLGATHFGPRHASGHAFTAHCL